MHGNARWSEMEQEHNDLINLDRVGQETFLRYPKNEIESPGYDLSNGDNEMIQVNNPQFDINRPEDDFVLVLKDDEYSVKREIDNSYEHDHDRDQRRVFVRRRSGSLADQPYSPSARPNRKPRRGGNQSPGVYKGRRMTYAELIMEAINSTPERRLTLRQIYDWMLANIKEFGPDSKDGPSLNSWKNSIRRNLSLHETFRGVPNEERGQSAYWVIDNEPKNQSSSFEKFNSTQF